MPPKMPSPILMADFQEAEMRPPSFYADSACDAEMYRKARRRDSYCGPRPMPRFSRGLFSARRTPSFHEAARRVKSRAQSR